MLVFRNEIRYGGGAASDEIHGRIKQNGKNGTKRMCRCERIIYEPASVSIGPRECRHFVFVGAVRKNFPELIDFHSNVYATQEKLLNERQ